MTKSQSINFSVRITMIPFNHVDRRVTWRGRDFEDASGCSTIARARYVKKLGEGSFGVVDALDVDGDLIVRKTYDTRKSQSAAMQAKMEFDVMKKLAECDKYNIACYRGYCVQGSKYQILMEYIDGAMELTAVIKYIRALPSCDKKNYVKLWICHRLAEMILILNEEGGVYHKDIKPDNIICNGNAFKKLRNQFDTLDINGVREILETTNIKFIDFGISCITTDWAVPANCYNPYGTIPYMSPGILRKRLYRGSRMIDPKAADEWAIASVMYEVIYRDRYASVVGGYGSDLSSHLTGYKNPPKDAFYLRYFDYVRKLLRYSSRISMRRAYKEIRRLMMTFDPQPTVSLVPSPKPKLETTVAYNEDDFMETILCNIHGMAITTRLLVEAGWEFPEDTKLSEFVAYVQQNDDWCRTVAPEVNNNLGCIVDGVGYTLYDIVSFIYHKYNAGDINDVLSLLDLSDVCVKFKEEFEDATEREVSEHIVPGVHYSKRELMDFYNANIPENSDVMNLRDIAEFISNHFSLEEIEEYLGSDRRASMMLSV